MKRQFTTFVTTLLLFVTSSAQPIIQRNFPDTNTQLRKQPYSSSSMARSMSIVKTASISAGDGQVWWNNHDSNQNNWGCYGTEYIEHYNVATFIPAKSFGCDGVTISAISIFPICESIDNVKVWISKSLPEFGADADIETKDVAKGDLVFNQFNDVAFSSECTIPSEGVYIGFSFDVVDWYSDYWWAPVLTSNSIKDREQGYLFSTTSRPSWQSGNGNLLIRALLGGALLGNAANVYDFETEYLVPDDTKTVSVTIENMGTKPITSVKYALTSDGEVVGEETVDVQISDFKAVAPISVRLTAAASAGASKKTITLKEVNGVPNELSGNIGYGKVVTVVNKPKVLPVIEEFTGTWCGYCPYGIVGMAQAHEQYGDNVALIAVHDSDPMAIDEYTAITRNVSSFPSAVANRGESFYPDTYRLPGYIDKAMNSVVAGAIDATAKWADNGKTRISIDTKTTFAYSENDARYGIAYVLVEDGMTNPDWYQRNFLTGESGWPGMDFWYQSPEMVYGFVFDHVAVAAWDVQKGVKGSVGSVIVEGQPMDYNFKADISDNSLIQDKSKLKLIAMLVDSQSGKIMNAAITTIETPGSVSETGNADGKGGVDVNDVVAIVNYLMGKAPEGFDKDAADVNEDGKVDLADIVMLINKILQAQ